ncbi:MAG: phenylacetate-CoA oxygenase subunit PaaJ [Schleiferiaceae bacterium]|nr:phenylacetate-CoA oxygenase subunit PaaJ [Schleiferiaceae bacterium]
MVNKEFLEKALESVMDPEVPVLSVMDLGLVRSIRIEEEAIHVEVAPTYTGCPAMDVIHLRIKEALCPFGVTVIHPVIHPPWTTDWMTEAGKKKLEAYGIAPPVGKASDKRTLWAPSPTVRCPRCKSELTSLVSLFGSTACKSLYQCQDCNEPFDYFKCF